MSIPRFVRYAAARRWADGIHGLAATREPRDNTGLFARAHRSLAIRVRKCSARSLPVVRLELGPQPDTGWKPAPQEATAILILSRMRGDP